MPSCCQRGSGDSATQRSGESSEGEERPSARWPQGRERQRRLRPTDTRTRRRAPFSGSGGGAGFTLALDGPAPGGDGDVGVGGRLLGGRDGVLPAARGVPEQ